MSAPTLRPPAFVATMRPWRSPERDRRSCRTTGRSWSVRGGGAAAARRSPVRAACWSRTRSSARARRRPRRLRRGSRVTSTETVVPVARGAMVGVPEDRQHGEPRPHAHPPLPSVELRAPTRMHETGREFPRGYRSSAPRYELVHRRVVVAQRLRTADPGRPGPRRRSRPSRRPRRRAAGAARRGRSARRTRRPRRGCRRRAGSNVDRPGQQRDVGEHLPPASRLGPREAQRPVVDDVDHVHPARPQALRHLAEELARRQVPRHGQPAERVADHDVVRAGGLARAASCGRRRPAPAGPARSRARAGRAPARRAPRRSPAPRCASPAAWPRASAAW